MKLHPIKSDKRYTITKEYCGYKEPRFIVRFCDEWVDQFLTYSGALVRAVGHKAVREGALVVTEIKA